MFTRNALLFLGIVISLRSIASANDLTISDIPANITPQLHSLIVATFSKNADDRAAAADGLEKLGAAAAPSVPFLIRLLSDDAMRPLYGIGVYVVRPRAQHALIRIGKPSLAPCIAALKKSTYDNRWELLSVVGAIDDPAAIEALLPFINDPNQKTARCAIGAIGSSGSVRAIDALGDLLEGGSPSFRVSAATSLGHIHDQRAVSLLLAALGDRSPNVGASAVRALESQKDPRIVPALVSAVRNRDGDPGFRVSAVYGLAKTRDPRAFDAILPLLREPGATDRIRVATAFALGDLGRREATSALSELANDGSVSAGVRAAALRAVSRIEGAGAIPLLAQLARSAGNPGNVRFWASVELIAKSDGAIDDESILPLLKGYRDPDEAMEMTSVKWTERDAALKKVGERGKNAAIRDAAKRLLKELNK